MTVPDWLADAVFYEIFPDRFANSDAALDPADVVPWSSKPTARSFFGGDLQGIIDHLDHVVAVGANALLLTPIFEAATNHRYDTKDYFSIDHRLGTLETFRALIAACRARGIRVVLDAVFDNAGRDHWAFRDVVENEADSRYVNWFWIEGFPVTSHPRPNYRTRSDFAERPRWNVYNPDVRAHHHDVARYWIDQGIDGWRLEAPYFVHRAFWRTLYPLLKADNPDLYVVAEKWRSPRPWRAGSIADGVMNDTVRDLILAFTANRNIDARALADGLNTAHANIREGSHRGMMNLLGSHDTERVLTRHRGDVDATLLAFAVLFALEGAPMIYYGDEVGMTGVNGSGCRGAMPWDEEKWSVPLLEGIRGLTQTRALTHALRRGRQRVVALDADTVAVVRAAHGHPTAVVIVHRGEGTVIDTGVVREFADLTPQVVTLGAESFVVLTSGA